MQQEKIHMTIQKVLKKFIMRIIKIYLTNHCLKMVDFMKKLLFRRQEIFILREAQEKFSLKEECVLLTGTNNRVNYLRH